MSRSLEKWEMRGDAPQNGARGFKIPAEKCPSHAIQDDSEQDREKSHPLSPMRMLSHQQNEISDLIIGNKGSIYTAQTRSPFVINHRLGHKDYFVTCFSHSETPVNFLIICKIVRVQESNLSNGSRAGQ